MTASAASSPAASSSLPRAARPPHRLLTLTEGRAIFELAAFVFTRPLMMRQLPRGDGHAVLVLPGFLASDTSTGPMRGLLESLGYDVHGWGLGRNLRVNAQRIRDLAAVLRTIQAESGGKVSLIGWSLGGVLAREIAKIHPDAVRQVITLGSPITDNRDHSNARALFELINGAEPPPEVDGHRFESLNRPPPVPTTSILTKGDGVVHWRGSVQHVQPDHDTTENILVAASHIGMGVNPSVMVALADRLAQPQGAWQPFRPAQWQRWMFPPGNVN